LSAKGFFNDCPWFGIPPHRHANILIEPLYPRLGLLGGSPSTATDGKMSKLAALAARRRQKENEKALARGGDKVQPQEKQTSSFSGSRNPQSSPSEPPERTCMNDGTETNNLDSTKDFLPSNPVANLVRCEPQLRSVEVRADSTNSPASLEPPTAVRANPSPFAVTIMARDLSAVDTGSNVANDFASAMSFTSPRAKPFDFTDPSPDDVVTKAQSSKGSN
jgi:elongation factor 1 alpha-like protein